MGQPPDMYTCASASVLPGQMPESIPAAPDTLWNTRYQDAALKQLRRSGFDVREGDVQRLSPLGHDHIIFPRVHPN
jgi:hypothetical protein